MTRVERAAAFRRLHQSPRTTALLLPNAWDAMSARIIEQAGAAAVATTSAGLSWALGRPDGQGITRDEMLEAVRRIVRAVRAPVSADIEGGYQGGTPDDVAATVRAVVDAGAVGINLEDSPGRGGSPLLEPGEQGARIRAARVAAGEADLFINARTDIYLMQVGPEAGRFEEVVRRAKVYAEAGADGLFVPGVMDAPTIGRLVSAVTLPLNIMAAAGAPSVADLTRLGVARVSVGPFLALVAMGSIKKTTEALLAGGDFGVLREGMPFPDANGMFGRSESS